MGKKHQLVKRSAKIVPPAPGLVDSDIPTDFDWDVMGPHMAAWHEQWVKDHANTQVEHNQKTQTIIDFVKSNADHDLPIELINKLEKELGCCSDIYCQVERSTTTRFLAGQIDENQFRAQMNDIITRGVQGAWAQGMEDNGLAYPDDMKPIWQVELDAMRDKERSFLDGFTDAINLAHDRMVAGSSTLDDELPEILHRADLWGRRYEDFRQRAQLICAKNNK